MIIQKAGVLYQQIVLHLEQQIFSGALAPGTRLDSTTALAKQFDVSPETVQIALKKLMERGLIDRRRGAGTFVRKGIQSRRMAIVFGEENFTEIDRQFYNVMLRKLVLRLGNEGWDTRYFITTIANERDASFHELERQIASGEIRAVIEFCSNDLLRDWLRTSCPVPYSLLDARPDFEQMTRDGLRYLHAHGRRKPVVLYSPTRNIHALPPLTSVVQEMVNELQLPDCLVVEAESRQRDGYQAICDLILDGEAFDSLLVLFDAACRGVLYALLEKRLRIPEDVALITHANKEVEIFSHLPLTKLEVDPDAFAASTIDQIRCKLAGETWEFQPIPATLVPGRSCGETAPLPEQPVFSAHPEGGSNIELHRAYLRALAEQ